MEAKAEPQSQASQNKANQPIKSTTCKIFSALSKSGPNVSPVTFAAASVACHDGHLVHPGDEKEILEAFRSQKPIQKVAATTRYVPFDRYREMIHAFSSCLKNDTYEDCKAALDDMHTCINHSSR